METVHTGMSFDWDEALTQRVHEVSSLNTILFCYLVTATLLCIYEMYKYWPTWLIYTKKTNYYRQTHLNVQQISRTCSLFTQQKSCRIIQKKNKKMDHSFKEFEVKFDIQVKINEHASKLLHICQNNTGLIVRIFANLWNTRLDHP